MVIDPRPLNLSLEQSKWSKGLFEPKRFGPVFSKWYPACFEGCKDTVSTAPKHIRSFFDSPSFEDFVSARDDSAIARTNAIFESELKRARQTKWTTKGLHHEDGTSFGETEEADEPEPITPRGSTQSTEITDPREARDLLENCKVVVGLHPDQAAGAHCRLCSRQRDTVVCGPMLRVLRLSKLQPAKAEEWQKRQELRRPLSVVARERSTGKNGDTRAGGKEQSYLHAAMTDHAQ